MAAANRKVLLRMGPGSIPRTLALLCLMGTSFGQTPPQEAPAPQPDKGSQGEFELLRSRARREAALAETAARRKVTDYLSSTLGTKVAVNSSLFEEQVARLVDLGPAAVPALIEALTPEVIRLPTLEEGTDEESIARRTTRQREQAILKASSRNLSAYRAKVAAHALRELATPAATDPLLLLINQSEGTPRINALLALATCPEPQRAAPNLILLLDAATDPAEQQAFLVSLARMGGTTAIARVQRSLDPSDPQQANVALSALAAAQVASVAPQLLTILRSDNCGAAMAGILAYYRAYPDLLQDNDHLEPLLAVLVEQRATRTNVTAALQLLLELRVKPSSRGKSMAEDLAELHSGDVKEAALKWLASTGNKRALRTLLEPLDEDIKKVPTYSAFHSRRGDLLYEVGEYKDALESYERGINWDRTGRTRGPYVGAARCHAYLGKFKAAAVALRESPLKRTDLSALVDDPAFKEMASKKQYWVGTFYRKEEDMPE